MTALIRFLDTIAGRWANVRMDNGDPCWIGITQTGVLVKKSKVGFFGAKLYEQKNVYKAAMTAKALWEQCTVDKTPPGMTNPVLKAFTNAVLHCSSLAEVTWILNQVDEAQSNSNARVQDRAEAGTTEPADAEKIVNAYGGVLAEPSELGVIRDARSLPGPKETIKDALMWALNVASDAAMREHIKTAYICLAEFQELSDNEVHALRAWWCALCRASSGSDVDLDEHRNLTSASGELVSAVQQRVAVEAKLLSLELKTSGF